MMIVDCMTCPVRDQRCDDCAVTALRAHGWAEHPTSAGVALSADRQSSAERQSSTELRLDAAESRVVSIFVGAGLVSAGAGARLRARPERMQHWGTVRDAG
jgi:hypothetical protein